MVVALLIKYGNSDWAPIAHSYIYTIFIPQIKFNVTPLLYINRQIAECNFNVVQNQTKSNEYFDMKFVTDVCQFIKKLCDLN